VFLHTSSGFTLKQTFEKSGGQADSGSLTSSEARQKQWD